MRDLYGVPELDSLGLTLEQIGFIAAAVSGVQMVLSYPAGMLADRFHPMRVMVWIKIGLVAIVPLNFIWLFGNFQPRTAFHILIALAAVELPLGLLYDTTRQPMQMRVWPKSRYGQFCSFNAIVQAACGILASVTAGLYMTAMRRAFPDDKCGQGLLLSHDPGLATALSLRRAGLPVADVPRVETIGRPEELQGARVR